MRGDEGLASQVMDSHPAEVTHFEEHVAFKDGIFTIGCVGEWERFHTRPDSKLQWWIGIAIFELPSVHTVEKTSSSLRFSIPEGGDEAWLVSVLFWHADRYFISDIILY